MRKSMTQKRTCFRGYKKIKVNLSSGADLNYDVFTRKPLAPYVHFKGFDCH